MAVDVTSLVRIMEAYNEEADAKRQGLYTRDLLGDVGSSAELDLDLQIPLGWERRLDLMSGKTSLHRIASDPPSRRIQDLNLPPPSSSAASLPEESALLDLKLSGAGIPGRYQSVCTLEKVRSALERAQRIQSEGGTSRASGSPASSSTTSSSVKRRGMAEEDDGGTDSAGGGMMATACPSCLLYVLISKANRRCPRCSARVPAPFIPKKARFDLNSSSS